MFFIINTIMSILVVASLNIIPNSIENKMLFSNQVQYQSIYNMDKYKLIASLPQNSINLFTVNWKEDEENHSGAYSEVLLEIDGVKRVFKWTVDYNMAFRPRLILNDINKDGKNELIVITTIGHGTGVNQEDIHIFNIENFNEIMVMSPLELIQQNVKTEIVKNNGYVNITINSKGQVFRNRANESSAVIWFDNVYFGNRISYDIVNDKLVAKVGAQVGASLFTGDIIVDYVFKNNKLELYNIIFEKYKDSKIFSKG